MVADMMAARAVISAAPIWFHVGMHGFVREARTINLEKAMLLWRVWLVRLPDKG
jgi:hypothetical protein